MKKADLMRDILKYGALAAVLAVALPESVLAVDTVGDIITNTAQDQVSPFATLISAVCYVAGAVMLAAGALSLRKHADNPASESVSKGVARLVVGACFMGLPYLSKIMQDTIFATKGVADHADFAANIGKAGAGTP